ncbi:MAG: sugar transferase [Chloroflexota bacterium]
MSKQTLRSRLHGKTDSTGYYYVKRLLDVTIALFTLIVLLPFLVVIALLIKLDSHGPIFFIQTRVGSKRRVEEGKVYWAPTEFSIVKFRTMRNNADESLHKKQVQAFVEGTLAKTDEGKVQTKIYDDPRITRFGHILRKTNLDEIPQLFNILRGEMSMVGPRPVPPYEAAYYTEHHLMRLTALPGITGLWQIKGRGHTGFEEMMHLDLLYIQDCSFWFDLKIMIQTIPAALRGTT